MPYISRINVNDTVYDIRTPVLASQTYTGLYGSANDAAGASFYFAKVVPDSYAALWTVRLRLCVTAPAAYAENMEVTVSGYGSTFASYDALVARNTGAVGVYYMNLYRATQTGVANGYGHLLGIGLRSSANPANASYARTVRAELLAETNCAVTLWDTAMKYANAPGTGSVNYTGLTEANISANGQNATNNNNNYDRLQHNNSLYSASANAAGKSYAIVGSSVIVRVDSGYQTLLGGTSFLLDYPVLWGNGNVNAKAAFTNAFEAFPGCTLRNNNAGTWTGKQYAMAYIVGTVSGRVFTADSTPITTAVPSEPDGKHYLPIGIMYSTYQIAFRTSGTLYAWCDGAFQPSAPLVQALAEGDIEEICE